METPVAPRGQKIFKGASSRSKSRPATVEGRDISSASTFGVVCVFPLTSAVSDGTRIGRKLGFMGVIPWALMSTAGSLSWAGNCRVLASGPVIERQANRNRYT